MGCSASSASAAVQPRESESKWITFNQNYDIGDVIGEGSFAQVRRSQHKKTKDLIAVKIVKTTCEKDKSRASRELEVWTQIGHHANVVGLLESYEEPWSTYFVMQQCRCSVSEIFDGKSKGVTQVDILHIFHRVFQGLHHCHSMNVVHRDIKAANLLIDFDGVVKLADFGLSLIVPKDGVTGVVGSTPYMSPEMVKGRKYGFGTDVWSAAAVLYFLVYGQYPYDATGEVSSTDERRTCMMKAIATNSPKPTFASANNAPNPSFKLQGLIQTLLQRDVTKRPDASLSADLILKLLWKLQDVS